MAYRKSTAAVAIALAAVAMTSCSRRQPEALPTPPNTTLSGTTFGTTEATAVFTPIDTTTMYSLPESAVIDTNAGYPASITEITSPLPASFEDTVTPALQTTTPTIITSTPVPVTTTPETTQQLTPINPEQIFYVNVVQANVRTAPSTTAGIARSVKLGTPVNVMAKTANGEWYQTTDGDFISSSVVTSTKPAETTKVPVTTKAPDVTSRPATTSKKLSARDIDTHGDPNVDVSALIERYNGDMVEVQGVIDDVVAKYGSSAVIRHVKGDGIIDPTYKLGPYMFLDPDGVKINDNPNVTIVRG